MDYILIDQNKSYIKSTNFTDLNGLTPRPDLQVNADTCTIVTFTLKKKLAMLAISYPHEIPQKGILLFKCLQESKFCYNNTVKNVYMLIITKMYI